RSPVGGVRLAADTGSVRLPGWHRGVLRAVYLRTVPGLYLVLPDRTRCQPRESRPLAGARSHVCRRKRRVLRGGRRRHHPRGGRHLPVSDRVETGGRHRRCITRARARRQHPTAVDRPPTRASRRPVTTGGRAILLRVRVRPGVDGLHYVSIIVLPLTSGFAGAALVTFASFASAMALMMLLTSLLVGLAKASVLHRLQASTVWIKRVSGAVLIVAGLYLGSYYIVT